MRTEELGFVDGIRVDVVEGHRGMLELTQELSDAVVSCGILKVRCTTLKKILALAEGRRSTSVTPKDVATPLSPSS